MLREMRTRHWSSNYIVTYRKARRRHYKVGWHLQVQLGKHGKVKQRSEKRGNLLEKEARRLSERILAQARCVLTHEALACGICTED